MSLPLKGLKVIDCSHGSAGPRATGMLADLGAEVIWVERPGGDPFRTYSPSAASVFNRNKRSIILDLKAEEGRRQLFDLLSTADVFVQSWRPGIADRMGIGWDKLHARFPGLVYCSISGFGSEGRWKDVPGYEAIVFAQVGTMAEQAGHRDPPIFQGLPFASIGAAYLGVIGVLAALYRKGFHGAGRHVETSLFDGATVYHSMLWGESDESLSGAPGTSTEIRVDQATSGRRIVTRTFRCADDRYVGVHTGAHGAFGRLMIALGLDDRIPPSESGMDMGQPLEPEQQKVLAAEIDKIFASQASQHWVDELLKADVCCIEHLNPTEVFDKPQAIHNEMVVEVNDPVLGPIHQVACPIKLDGEDTGPIWPAPAPGADTAAILTRLEQQSVTAGPTSIGSDRRPLLEGVKVLDLGAYFAGPFSSRILADLGADVIKVEPVRGDQLRGLERPFFAAQSGKRSVAADLKNPALAAAVESLLDWADIVHHNLRPGAAERLGLDYRSVVTIKPDSIYLYAPGWGSTGPHALRQSFAPMLSGYAGVTFEVAGQFNEPMPPVGNEDPGNGLVGVVGVLIALLVKQRSGRGSYVENPQLNATMAHMAHVVRTEDGEVIGAGHLDSLQYGFSALERLYETADGWICLVALDDARAHQLGRILGIDLEGDPRFASFVQRQANDYSLSDLIGSVVSSWTTADLLKELEAADIAAVEPAGANRHALMIDPELRVQRRVAEVWHPVKGNVREFDLFFSVTDTDAPPHRLAPELGEHTAEVLVSFGYQLSDLRRLRDEGVVAFPDDTVSSE